MTHLLTFQCWKQILQTRLLPSASEAAEILFDGHRFKFASHVSVAGGDDVMLMNANAHPSAGPPKSNRAAPLRAGKPFRQEDEYG